MLTEPQQKKFEMIRMNKLTPKEKGDFYFRMSVILKKRLDELETISCLLKEIPRSYQSFEKINFLKAANLAMEITEELVERLDPAFVSPIIKDSAGNECDYPPHKDGKHRQRVGSRIIRRYQINVKSYMPGLTGGIATIRVAYEPSKAEIDFLDHLTNHQSKLDEVRTQSERNSHVFSAKEFNESILPRLKKRGKNFEVKLDYAVGRPKNEMPLGKSIEEFSTIEERVDASKDPDVDGMK